MHEEGLPEPLVWERLKALLEKVQVERRLASNFITLRCTYPCRELANSCTPITKKDFDAYASGRPLDSLWHAWWVGGKNRELCQALVSSLAIPTPRRNLVEDPCPHG